jgi:ABC-2 type transport system ATP-binding protein
MIEVNNLVKDYKVVRALDGVSFKIEKGEVVGFLGPNGAGKTTCMKIITGFISATSGEVKVASLDVVENGVEVRKRIGYLPENAPLYPDMTPREYLAFVSTLRGIDSKEVPKRIEKVAQVVGITDRLDQEIGTLSKGYRQRVGLAQAMIHDPEILILDEPTSGLDPNQIVEMRDIIKEIGKQRTVILSTHNLPEVTATCNRIIIIHKGRIAADGTPDQIQSAHGGGNFYIVEVEKHDSVDLASLFSSIAGAKHVAVLASSGTSQRLRIEGVENKDLRKDIFELCVQKGLTLLGLQRERLDLETIFQRITVQ